MTGYIESLQISASPYINALISVLVFVVIAKIVDVLVDRVLRKFTRFTKTDIDDKIIDLIHRPIFFTIIIIGAVLSISYLKPAPNTLFYSGGILYSTLAVIWCVTFIRISNLIIEHAIYKVSDVTGLSKDVIPLVENISKIAIIVAVLMAILSIWKVNITPLIASAGIAGAAVAFAAKDTIANFFGGISVFVDKPFKIGDYIVLDRGERGEVVAIGVRSTRIKTRDDTLITIPNSIIANTKIINESAPIPNFRVRIPVAVAYGSDIDMVQKVLLELVKDNENVLPDPPPRVRFREFGESSLNFELLCWAKEPSLRGLTTHELNCAIYKKFGESGIKIPFPQRDIHLYRD
ncbi:MAG: mechanosensitive ion channel domain-containing protein [Nitrospirota bacterium]